MWQLWDRCHYFDCGGAGDRKSSGASFGCLEGTGRNTPERYEWPMEAGGVEIEQISEVQTIPLLNTDSGERKAVNSGIWYLPP
jgi:hypothetical protein